LPAGWSKNILRIEFLNILFYPLNKWQRAASRANWKTSPRCCRIAIAILLASGMVAATPSQVSEMVSLLWKARLEKRMVPLLSKAYPGFNLETAYQVQKGYVKRSLKGDAIGGYKAGLTSPASQKSFGLSAPMAGVLLASGGKGGAPIIAQSTFKWLAVEAEVGLVIGKPITHKLDNVSALRERIRAVVPAIELPDLGFADMRNLKGVDIIAANAGAAGFIVGSVSRKNDGPLNPLKVVLTVNGKEMSRWEGSMEGRWDSALWLVNNMVEQGWEIEPGQVLLTGVLGEIVPGNPGNYIADFGKLGRISFEVR
jgi:2-keto-4-pentenoate hydratase